MHYRGKRVPLSEKSPWFNQAGVTTRSWEKPRQTAVEPKRHFLAFGAAEKEAPRATANASGTFYRPGRSRSHETADERRESGGNEPRGRVKAWKGAATPSLRIAMRAGAFLVLILVLVWSKNRTVSLLQDLAGLKLEKVSVEGNRYLGTDEVVKAMALPLGESMFKLDLKSATQRVRQLDWVDRVFVERRLPRTILVSIRERKPVALLDHGDLYGVDREGRVLSPAAPLLRDDLPLISGVALRAEAVGTTQMAETLKPALDFFEFLGQKDPVLGQDVSEVSMSEGDSMKVTFMDGLQARFNPPVTETELKRMTLVVSDLQEKGKKARVMDLRYHDLVLVRPRE